jgi:hypothetical protein
LAFPLDGPQSVARLRAELGEVRFHQVLGLNRIDLPHTWRADTLVIPVPGTDFHSLSPFPDSVETAVPKVVLVSLQVQAFAAYESGHQVKWGAVSTGRPHSPTPSGLYHVNWKSPEHRSTIDNTWLMRWCMNIDNQRGVALHQFALPGYAASHRCIRLLEEDALWLYNWVSPWMLSPDGREVIDSGTPVIVFGSNDPGDLRPWRRLPSNPHATDISPSEIEEALVTLDKPPI